MVPNRINPPAAPIHSLLMIIIDCYCTIIFQIPSFLRMDAFVLSDAPQNPSDACLLQVQDPTLISSPLLSRQQQNVDVTAVISPKFGPKGFYWWTSRLQAVPKTAPP